jgi:hypothetical protein
LEAGIDKDGILTIYFLLRLFEQIETGIKESMKRKDHAKAFSYSIAHSANMPFLLGFQTLQIEGFYPPMTRMLSSCNIPQREPIH